MKTTRISKVFFVIFSIFLFPIITFADWQSDLESHFDIVETFDQLQDWHGSKVGYIYDSAYMPKKLNGSPSIWTLYDVENSAYKEDWIADHGAGYNWKSDKSLCINYDPLYCDQDTSPLIGYGPARLGLYLGDGTPQSGYHVMHVFYMMKFPPDFWLKDPDGSYTYPPVIKVFDMITGFESSNKYGAPTCDLNQVEYGSNYTLFNVGGGGDSTPNNLFFKLNTRVSEWNDSEQCYAINHLLSGNQLRNADFASQFAQGKWIGVEYKVDLGTLNTADGNVEIWLYDEDGNVIGHDAKLNIEMQRLLSFNYNKIILGGNYQCIQDVHKGRVADTRIYYDDFIVDDQRIGPSYFSLLNSQNSTSSRADVDNNSQINTTDAMLALRNSLGLDMSGTNWQTSTTTGDVNCDGNSNSTDAMLILRYSLGLSMEGTGWCVN